MRIFVQRRLHRGHFGDGRTQHSRLTAQSQTQGPLRDQVDGPSLPGILISSTSIPTSSLVSRSVACNTNSPVGPTPCQLPPSCPSPPESFSSIPQTISRTHCSPRKRVIDIQSGEFLDLRIGLPNFRFEYCRARGSPFRQYTSVCFLEQVDKFPDAPGACCSHYNARTGKEMSRVAAGCPRWRRYEPVPVVSTRRKFPRMSPSSRTRLRPVDR